MTIIRDKSVVGTKKDAFYVLEPTKYYCPKKHSKSSFAGEIKDGSSTDTPFVFSREFKKTIDDIFKD